MSIDVGGLILVVMLVLGIALVVGVVVVAAVVIGLLVRRSTAKAKAAGTTSPADLASTSQPMNSAQGIGASPASTSPNFGAYPVQPSGGPGGATAGQDPVSGTSAGTSPLAPHSDSSHALPPRS
ncbi:hypothetical protein [Brachybacterium timonense]|uniref:hypothetical protein n=1 Tax=Brachybacterium timonense TaxID=2050896 RepID=UPI00110D9E20|nr:hypothetical protein [Brachybacterium timonense]